MMFELKEYVSYQATFNRIIKDHWFGIQMNLNVLKKHLVQRNEIQNY